MKYLKFTYVDAVTGISVASHPAANGPVFPAVKGLEYAWARESQYPTEVPEFFGTCPDDADTQVDGVLGVYLQADWETLRDEEILKRSIAAREAAKRKRAEAVANIKVTTAAGNTFDGDEESQGRMSRAILGLLSNQTEASGVATIPWVLADNTVIQADAAELTEAMTLAGLEQARLWVIE